MQYPDIDWNWWTISYNATEQDIINYPVGL